MALGLCGSAMCNVRETKPAVAAVQRARAELEQSPRQELQHADTQYWADLRIGHCSRLLLCAKLQAAERLLLQAAAKTACTCCYPRILLLLILVYLSAAQ